MNLLPQEHEGGELITGLHAEYWALLINEEWRKTTEGVIQTGTRLIEAKGELDHGEWGKLTGQTVEDGKGLLHFRYNTAARLMSIASDPRVSNMAHGPYLPSAWRTLYELTKLDDEAWEKSSTAMGPGRLRPRSRGG